MSTSAKKRPRSTQARFPTQKKSRPVQSQQMGARVPVKSIEKKFLDQSIVNTADITAGAVASLNLVPQGTTDVTRVGNKITLKNLNIMAIASLDDQTTTTYVNGVLRVIVGIDKQANGANPAVTDILKTATFASFRNMDQVDRFEILKEKIIPIPVESTNALHTSSAQKLWKINLKLNHNIHFSGATGAITEVRSNNLFLLVIANNAVVNATGGNQDANANARIKFIDL